MPEASSSTSEIDFLVRPFASGNGVERNNRGFSTTSPWAIARYRGVRLSKGWWVFEADGGTEELQARVNDDNGLIFSGDASQLRATRMYIGQATVADIDLIVSPWPGSATFTRLRLRHFTTGETLHLLLKRVRGLFRQAKPFSKAVSIMRRLRSGISFGARAASGSGMSGFDPGASLHPALESGICKLDERTSELVKKTFERLPHVHAIYGDAIDGRRLLPTTEWDPERAKWFEFAAPPIFFRNDADDAFQPDSWSRLKQAVAEYGEQGVHRIPLPLAIRPMAHPSRVLDRPPAPELAVTPRVSIVIPTKYRMDLLERCLTGLADRTDYPSFEVVIVDNGSTDPRLPGILAAAAQRLQLISVFDGGDFNFSRLINIGARAATGEILLLLNDDVHPLERDWLVRMVSSVLDPATGAVGARLLYPSGDIQHAGIAMGLGGVCGHLWRHTPRSDADQNPHIVFPGKRMAVTGACLAVRRAVFEQVGGLDEERFAVTLNDVDFCLRLREIGLATIYRGDAVLLHEESQSRGSDDIDRRKIERRRKEVGVFRQMWGTYIDNDPYFSPLFDPSSESGVVRIPAPRF